LILLDLEDVLHIAERVLPAVEVRDAGLLEAAVARPRASAFGEEAYPTLHEKAAALLHSLVRSHALVDGNKRLGLAGIIAFHGMNGFRLTFTNDEAHDLVVAVAAGDLDDVSVIAERLAARSEPRARTTPSQHAS
jgi:death on curing protein